MSIAKKILVVVESIDVEDSSGSKANVALIQNLYKAGFDLLVYHYTRKEIQLPGIVCVAIKENRRSLLFYLSRLERTARDHLMLDVHKPLQNIFGFSFTLLNDRNSIVTAMQNIVDFIPDLVLSLSKGGSFRPHHALLRMPQLHKKWIAYMHDPYPMHHYPKPFTYTEPGSARKERFIREISNKAAFSAFPSKLLQEWMGNFYPGFLKSGFIIPHQIGNSKGFLKSTGKFGLAPNKFSVLHAGNLLQARNPRSLVEGFIKFKEDEPTAVAQLILIGPAPYAKAYLKEQSKLHSYIQVYPETKPFNEVLALQDNVDVNIILEAEAEFSPFLPGKFPHCIHARKPILVLGPEKSEVRRLLGNDYPFCSTIDDPDKIAKILKVLYNNWKEGKHNLIREDLEYYLSEKNLKVIIDSIQLKY